MYCPDCCDCTCAGGDDVIFQSNRVRIMLATKPVDFRKGHDGLAALVKNELYSLRSCHAYCHRQRPQAEPDR